MELNKMTIIEELKFKNMSLVERIESLDDYHDKSQYFLDDTGSYITWELTGLSDRFNSNRVTLEYKYRLVRGSRTHEGLYNSSLNDLYTLLKFKENKINPDCLLAKNIITDFYQQLKSKVKTITISYEGKRIVIERCKIPVPSSYHLLASLDVDYSSDVDDFCANFGYSFDDTSIKHILEVYEGVKKQSNELKMLYSDSELEALQAIN